MLMPGHDSLAVAEGPRQARALAARQDGRDQVEGEAVRVGEAGRLPAEHQMRLLLGPLHRAPHDLRDGRQRRGGRRRVARSWALAEGASTMARTALASTGPTTTSIMFSGV